MRRALPMIMVDPIRADSASGSTPRERIARAALWAALAVALVGRVAYLDAKPFWRDEAWVALLVADSPPAQAMSRPVPIGFLLLAKATAALPALSPEVSYRLVPLLCGLALLPLLGRLGVALGVVPLTAVAAVWLAAGVTPLVYYSRELKPYGVDALLAVLVPLLAIVGFSGATPRRAARWGFVASLAVAPWVSFGALFPIMAVLSWGWLVWWRHADRTWRRAWLLASVAFVSSFAAVYVLAVHDQIASPRLRFFWRKSLFADRGVSLPRRVAIATSTYFSLSLQYFFPQSERGYLAVAAIGALTWPKSHRAFLGWLYLGSAAFCISAAVVDRYLVADGRFMLFSLPPLMLWVANGVNDLGRRIRTPAGPYLALAFSIAVGFSWTVAAIRHRVEEPYHSRVFRYDVLQDVDAIVGQASVLVPPDEPILISPRSAYAFQVYRRGRLPQAQYCERLCVDEFPAIAIRWLEQVEPRGWVILTDEETAELGPFFERAGFASHQRGTARGMFLWELTPRNPRAPAL